MFAWCVWNMSYRMMSCMMANPNNDCSCKDLYSVGQGHGASLETVTVRVIHIVYICKRTFVCLMHEELQNYIILYICIFAITSAARIDMVSAEAMEHLLRLCHGHSVLRTVGQSTATQGIVSWNIRQSDLEHLWRLNHRRKRGSNVNWENTREFGAYLLLLESWDCVHTLKTKNYCEEQTEPCEKPTDEK